MDGQFFPGQRVQFEGGPLRPFDAYFASVELLLHCNGSDASTTFTDNSKNAFTMTVGGNAQIDTAESKFGGASALFDGVGDYLSVAHATAFDFSGDYTIEFFMRRVAQVNTGNWCVTDFRGGVDGGPNFYLDTSNRLNVYVNGTVLQTSALTSGQWYHIALCRVGSTHRLFVDGTSVASVVDTVSFNTVGVSIACFYTLQDTGGNFKFKGHIDEYRVTKGIGRYSANFSAPTAPFPHI